MGLAPVPYAPNKTGRVLVPDFDITMEPSNTSPCQIEKYYQSVLTGHNSI